MKINLLIRFFFLSFLITGTLTDLSTAQTQKWLARYNGTSNQTDDAYVMYVDASGNSYVGGTAYDTSGGQQMVVVKYDSAGHQQWVQRYGNSPTLLNAIAVDNAGDVFITGYTTDFNSSFVLIAYNSSGVLLWNKNIGPANVSNEGFAIATDQNFVYVAGKVVSYIYPDFEVAKFDIATGTMQSGWPEVYNGTGNNEDIPRSIAVDASGNVFVTGSSKNGSGDKDFLTIGYNASGAPLNGWPQRWDGPSNTDDTPVQLLLSGSNVIVTGICNQGTGSDTTGDICTIMYDYSGNIVSGWPQIYNGTGNSWDGVGNTASDASFKPMAADGAGNIYVGGWSRNSSLNYDMIILKFSSGGALQAGWPRIYDNGGNDDIIRGLALDASNDVCITGWSAPYNTFNNGDYVTIEYDNNGNAMGGWPVIYSGTGGGDNQAMAIQAVGAGIWITGYSFNAGTFSDYVTIKYSNSNLTVGVNDQSLPGNSIVVYPNPSGGKFTILNADLKSQLTVVNTLGEVIYQFEITSSQQPVDLSGESKGIYFYRLVSEDRFIASGKMIVD